MKLFEYIERINLLHKLISERRTGCPEILAKRLGISTSRLYVVLDELKLMGAPISYSRETQSYFYYLKFDIEIKASFKLLDNQELQNINAGITFNNYEPLLFL
mgnify:CR=1 FL=1